VKAAVRRALLRLERYAVRVVPHRWRQPLRALVPRPREITLEPWESPFVPGRPAPTWPPASAADVPAAAPSPGPAPPTVRCLLVTDSMDAGGVDEVVSLLARRLPEHGIAVAVMMASADRTTGIGRLGRALQAQGIEVVDPEPPDGPGFVAAWRPDIVYVHGGGMEWPIDTAVQAGIPVILALHGMHDLFAVDGAHVAALEGRLDAVVAVSDLVRREYLAKSPALDPRKTVVIPNGVDLGKVTGPSRDDSRRALGLQDEVLFLSLSRHCLQKNSYALVDAFQDVARALPTAHLLVCGRVDEPVYTRQILALRERSPVRDRIHLRDNAQRTDVLLGAADVFVLDSFFEGWALASMEALAAGVPVVLSDVGGAREQLTGSIVGGALVSNPAGDPTGLTWETMMRARYLRQGNRDELVEAMLRVARGDGVATRAEIAADARERFASARSVAAHAELLRRVARSVTAASTAEPR